MRLYELAGADPKVRFSPYCWRIRLALAAKGLDADYVPWRFTETEAIGFSGQGKVPVLVDGDRVVTDSWAIARHLETAYPATPALLGGPEAEALVQFATHWADRVLIPAVVRLIAVDIPKILDTRDAAYFEASRAAVFGKPIAEVCADRESRVLDLRRSLEPFRASLRERPHLGGDTPNYADFAVFSVFQWARVASPFALVTPEDPVTAWIDRLLDAYGGLARATPAAA